MPTYGWCNLRTSLSACVTRHTGGRRCARRSVQLSALPTLWPMTSAGRMVAFALMIGGIALRGTVTATLASWLVETVEAEKQQSEDLQAKIRRLEARSTSVKFQSIKRAGMDRAQLTNLVLTRQNKRAGDETRTRTCCFSAGCMGVSGPDAVVWRPPGETENEYRSSSIT
jgi:hypothetical protein